VPAKQVDGNDVLAVYDRSQAESNARGQARGEALIVNAVDLSAGAIHTTAWIMPAATARTTN